MLTGSLRSIASHAGRQVPVWLWRRLFPKTDVSLCYHMVSDASPRHVRHYPILSTSEFESDLSYLRQHFNFVTYDELVRRRSSPHPVRDNSVILTFDDGFAECSTVVAPILRRHGIDCVFFIITDLIDNAILFRETEASLCIDAVCQMPVETVAAILDEAGLTGHLRPPPNPTRLDHTRTPLGISGLDRRADRRLWPLLHWLLTTDEKNVPLLRRLSARLGVDPQAYLAKVQPYQTAAQIRQLRADGFTIGAHSCSHRWLQDLSPDEARHEIVESCRIVRDITGQSTVPFAFPYFGGGLARTWLADIRNTHDFVGLFFDTDGLREDVPFVVQRVFGERFGHDRTVDGILRRAWSRRPAWYW
jgi:peptidoglycan/xylan/chitin deacetylase (PgdA/CDA1 family)